MKLTQTAEVGPGRGIDTYLYLLEMDKNAVPWSAVFLSRSTPFADQPKSYPCLGELVTSLNNPYSTRASSVIFQEQPPASLAAREALLKYLYSANQQLAPIPDSGLPNTLVAWLPEDIHTTGEVENYFVGQLVTVGHRGELQVNAAHPLNISSVGGSTQSMALAMPKQQLKFGAHGDSLVFLGQQAPSLVNVPSGGGDQVALTVAPITLDEDSADSADSDGSGGDTYFAIPMAGADSGSVSFQGQTSANFRNFALGFELVEQSGHHSVAHSYPLLAAEEPFENISLHVNLAPLALTNAKRSWLQFSEAQTFVSSYVSLLGTALKLNSTAEKSVLRFYRSGDEYLYLAPSGRFGALPL